MKKQSRIFNLFEAVPLILFLGFYRVLEPATPQDWLAPYLAGAIAAVLTVLISRIKSVPMNPVFIGINIYLLSGYVGLVTRQAWLNQLYGNFQASGMLAWVIIVGVASLLFSPAGFIGIDSKNRRIVVAYSVCLLAIAIVAFLLAYSFRTNRLFAETVPFVILFLAHGVLKSRANAKISLATG